MLVIAYRRCGCWLRPRTLASFLAAAALLCASQWFAAVVPGASWGVLPTCLVASGCFYAYRRALSSEA
jgi:hypothetical protein